MAIQAVDSKNLLSQFLRWGDRKKSHLLSEDSRTPVVSGGSLAFNLGQEIIFRNDFKRHIHAFSALSKYTLATHAQHVALLAISPFAIFAEIYRLCSGSIDSSRCLHNIRLVPGYITSSIIKEVSNVVTTINMVVSAASISIGFLTWHGGERLVRLINGSSHTILSNNSAARDIVYLSIGETLLAAVTVFIPIAPIQMLALPIIIGSIYGIIDNQFTVRECPEYYTTGNTMSNIFGDNIELNSKMGCAYDGTSFRSHAIKTNNILIKPIITGCYEEKKFSRFAGVILAAVGTIPYTAAALPVSYAGAMIAGICLISLVTAHVFSSIKKNSIQKILDAYAALIGITWDKATLNETWYSENQQECIRNKQTELDNSSPSELPKFNQSLTELMEDMNSTIHISDVPIKYIKGWVANDARQEVGYLFANGMGALAIAVSTIFLRVFVL